MILKGSYILRNVFITYIFQLAVAEVLKNTKKSLERFENIDQFWLGAEYDNTMGWSWTNIKQNFEGKPIYCIDSIYTSS